eukprot:GGOE01036452.1.p1 GENE.GGOE01036452.1~~GGOE01036452.1.p1  ORF type:complete len:258 (+),score=36.79 GGOE01036452.1:84-857(+)
MELIHFLASFLLLVLTTNPTFNTNAEEIIAYEGSCSFPAGAVRKALRGKSLNECTALFKEARRDDSTLNGLEASLDNRQLCWLISGIRGMKKLNPKLRCLIVQEMKTAVGDVKPARLRSEEGNPLGEGAGSKVEGAIIVQDDKEISPAAASGLTEEEGDLGLKSEEGRVAALDQNQDPGVTNSIPNEMTGDSVSVQITEQVPVVVDVANEVPVLEREGKRNPLFTFMMSVVGGSILFAVCFSYWASRGIRVKDAQAI